MYAYNKRRSKIIMRVVQRLTQNDGENISNFEDSDNYDTISNNFRYFE